MYIKATVRGLQEAEGEIGGFGIKAQSQIIYIKLYFIKFQIKMQEIVKTIPKNISMGRNHYHSLKMQVV